MQSFGTDRIRVAEDGRVILVSRYSKRWEPRVGKTLTTSEHPGTAVFLGDEYYEVVEATAQGERGARYVLVKWKDEHAIRVADRYDEETEARRAEDYEAAISREKRRKTLLALGILAGHLPAAVQERMGSELGVLPTRLTMLSLLIPFVIVAAIVWDTVSRVMAEKAPSMPLILLAGFLFAECAVRFMIVMTQMRPAGSVAGMLAYLVAYTVGPRKQMVSPFVPIEHLSSAITTSPDEERRFADEILLKEPLLTLLTSEEQELLAARFDYDHRRQSFKTAIRLLIIAIIGIVSCIATLRVTPRLSAAISLVAAALLGFEQIMRVRALRRGPTSSVLAVVARPFARRLLEEARKPLPPQSPESP
ncbi:MAG: hypothetical protein ABI837_19760 [Acidobacteriota bacterium]